MIFHYGGKYKSEKDLEDKGRVHDNATPFREPDLKVFAVIANGGSILILAVLVAALWIIAKPDLRSLGIQMGIAAFTKKMCTCISIRKQCWHLSMVQKV